MKKFISIFDKLIVKLLMSIVPTVWFAFFSIFASQTRIFINEANQLTPLSIIINIIMLAVMFVFALGIAIEQSYKKSVSLKSEKMYNSIISKIVEGNSILRNKQVENIDTQNIDILKSDYSSIILIIINELLSCLAEISQVKRENFVATYYYKPRKEQDWKSISSDDGYKGIKQSDLLSNPNSVLGQLLPEPGTIFYPSKEKALNLGKYIADIKDEDQKKYKLAMGSIFGANWRVTDSDGNSIFDNIITIATYGQEICSENDLITKKAIIESVLNVFRQQFWQVAFSYEIL